MEALMKDLNALESKGNLGKSIEDVQRTIDLLINARNAIASESKSASMTLAKLQGSVRQSFDKINDDLKVVHSGLNKYSKVLDKQFKDKSLPVAETDAISAHPALTNRAIAMHLLREGEFEVASTFIEEANKCPPSFSTAEPQTTISSNKNPVSTPSHNALQDQQQHQHQQHQRQQEAWEQDFAQGTVRSESLQRQFAEMYHILHELRQRHELGPAITWARTHSAELESRGSNLEFELCRLQFITFFLSDTPYSTSSSHPSSSNTSSTSLSSDPNLMSIDEPANSFPSDAKNTSLRRPSQEGPLRAWAYARSEFGNFQARYAREIQELVGAIAFWQNMAESPYRHLFGRGGAAWDEVAGSFAREFCSLLGLSAESPLYSAATAGAIALPRIMKMQSIMKEKRTEWTTQHELPIEIPLPPAYHFHSIFVCPVSKEQGTDQNPPMMMPCGHVIAKESLEKLSKGSLFKCPYCPNESRPRDAKKVFL